MKSRISLLVLVAAWSASAVAQTGPAVTDVYPVLKAEFQPDGSMPPQYAPGVYQIGPAADGIIGMYTHGNCLGACEGDTGGDSLFRWRRNGNGSWALSGGGITPHKNGYVTVGGETIAPGADPYFKETLNELPLGSGCQADIRQLTGADASGIFGTPEFAVIGNKVFMAFLKGNGDGYTGELWWAMSQDGGSVWYVHGPLIYSPQHRNHNAEQALGCNEGFTETAMLVTTDMYGQKWFNIYGMYDQPDSEYDGRSSIHYRVKYDPANWYGLSSTRELFYNGRFMAHDGRLYWAHDGAAGGLDAELVDATWDDHNGRSIISCTSATSSGPNSHYMIVDGLQLLRSTDGLNWSAPQPINTSALQAHYGTDYRLLSHNAIFYGTMSGITGFWGFFSLEDPQFTNPGSPTVHRQGYWGTRILPVRLHIP